MIQLTAPPEEAAIATGRLLELAAWVGAPIRRGSGFGRRHRPNFLRSLFSGLVAQHLKKLLAWRHPAFSAHVGEAIAPEEKRRLDDTAAYLLRSPLSLQQLVYLDGEQAGLYRSRMNPLLGRNFEAMDPLGWLARLSDQIPDPGQHRTLFYRGYSNRVRGTREPVAAEVGTREAEEPRQRLIVPLVPGHAVAPAAASWSSAPRIVPRSRKR